MHGTGQDRQDFEIFLNHELDEGQLQFNGMLGTVRPLIDIPFQKVVSTDQFT